MFEVGNNHTLHFRFQDFSQSSFAGLRHITSMADIEILFGVPSDMKNELPVKKKMIAANNVEKTNCEHKLFGVIRILFAEYNNFI